MPSIDMPVVQLEKYEGCNPKPEDFDQYWEDAKVEMKMADSKVLMQLSDFSTPTVDCYDMYFTGVNGARIHVKHLRPKRFEGKIPAVLQFHGYCYYAGSWIGERLAYAASGIAVFAMDVRGQGGESQDVASVWGNTQNGHIIRGLQETNPHKLLYRDIFLDTAQLADIVMSFDFVDESRVYTMGESQGGALALACAGLEPRIAKAAVASPFLCDYKRVWELDLGKMSYAELKDFFRNYDPMHIYEEAIFTKLGYIDVQFWAQYVRGDVLMFTGLMDDVCPPSAQYAVYNKLKCKKHHILYPDFSHEYFKNSDEIIFDFLVNDRWEWSD